MTPYYGPVFEDIQRGIVSWDIWGRLGWRETKRRYRRTTIGPFWTTLSLAIFVVVLGVLWSQLWHQDPKVYLPYLTSGMICWILFSSIVTDGSLTFVNNTVLITQLPTSYTLLACAAVWRNLIIFGHNFLIYVLAFFYGGLSLSWATLLVIPGMFLLAVNGVWISLLLGLATARYRDIHQFVSSLLQVAMFVTPIFWAPGQLQGRHAVFVDYNLLYHYIQVVRGPLLGQTPSWWSWFMVCAATVLGWSIVLFLLARFRRRIPYWL